MTALSVPVEKTISTAQHHKLSSPFLNLNRILNFFVWKNFMKTTNKERINLFFTRLKGNKTVEKVRGNNKTAYTRKRKFLLCDILGV